MKRIHEASPRTYGTPRIHAELAGESIQVGRKRVERLTQANVIFWCQPQEADRPGLESMRADEGGGVRPAFP
ncbi:MAG TPA: hypothetical protein DIU07_21670 [Rhodobacteraceae bacterium]|nr:hypothetical protein [Paracoccaceae bacterium]